MIDRKQLLSDLKKQLVLLEDDMRTRLDELPERVAELEAEFAGARKAGRSSASFVQWRDETTTQAAVAWLLACVFCRFIEDNGLVGDPLITGADNRWKLADEVRQDYFSRNPLHNDRDYLESVFDGLAQLPGAHGLFRREFNPLWQLGPTADGAHVLLDFWRRIDPETGRLAHDFEDENWDTRFLGDLYQDLSEAVRKKYALLQTPDFVEEFILDRTLDPAVKTFGLAEFRMIDPTCGSGHFLLGAFQRLFSRWCNREPGTETRALAQRALDAVHGVDVNPYAVAIARFRLLVAALQACEIRGLASAPDFQFNLANGDSLYHGKDVREGYGQTKGLFDEIDPLGHVYDVEDYEELKRILNKTYHAVVGNPPYIVVRDKAINQAYRDRYYSTHRQYSLGVPFTERFFLLAVQESNGQDPGYVGLITANSFMKREFGKQLIERVFPRLELSHIIDTSGAYIPGHSTPTVGCQIEP